MASKIPHPKRAPIRAKNYRSNRRTCVRSVRNGISALLRTDFSTYAACCQLILASYMQFKAKNSAQESRTFTTCAPPLCATLNERATAWLVWRTQRNVQPLCSEKLQTALCFRPKGHFRATLRPLVKEQDFEGFSLAVTHNVTVGMTPVTSHAQPPVFVAK